MASSSRAWLAAFFSLALSTAAASAEDLELRPRHEVGDYYLLSLSSSEATRAAARSVDGDRISEELRLGYEAAVVVLAVDAAGRPTRELHEEVKLTVARPDASGSLFRPDASYEVHYRRDGVRLFVDGDRLDSRAEEIVGRILAERFENTLEAELLDPGRPVEVGETWELDEAVVRRFLAARGVDVIELGGPAIATLRRHPDDPGATELVIDYRIPVDWFDLDGVPAGARVARTEALLQGEIRLAPHGPRIPTARSAGLELVVDGSRPGLPRGAPAMAWSLRRTERTQESVVRLGTATAESSPVVTSRTSPR